MRVAITSFNKIGPKSILATGRLFHFLGDLLGADKFHDPKDFVDWDKDPNHELYDAVICINGIPTYCKARDEMYQMWDEHAKAGKKIYWIGQDYSPKMRPQTGQINAFLKSPCFKLVAAFVPEAWMSYTPKPSQYKWIDWQQLSFRSDLPEVTDPQVPNSLVYYGAAREQRTGKFRKYFAVPSTVTRYFSAASSLARGAIENRIGEKDDNGNTYCPHIEWIPTFQSHNVPECVSKYAATLHIEDEISNGWFCGLPNRMYEALSSGTLLLIDKDATHSYLKSGFTKEDIEPFIVDGMGDVELAMEFRNELLQLQRETFLKCDYYKRLVDQVTEFFVSEGVL